MKNIIQNIKSLMSKPTAFFKKLAKEKTFNSAFLLVVVFYVITMGITSLQALFVPATVPEGAPLGFAKAVTFVSIIINFGFGIIFGLAMLFLMVLIIHGFFKLFKGKGRYKDTFNLMVYSAVPSYLLGILMAIFSTIVVIVTRDTFAPLVTMIPAIPLYLGAFVWQVVLVTIGGSIMHKISRGNAFVAGVVLPFLLGLFIALIILFVVGASLLYVFSQTGAAVF